MAEVLHHESLQLPQDRLLIPASAIQQVLERVRSTGADGLGELPAVLALGRGEQAPQVLACQLTRLAPPEEPGEAGVEGCELLTPTVQSRRGHGNHPLRAARPVTLLNHQSDLRL
jgi:hypothetical protein